MSRGVCPTHGTWVDPTALSCPACGTRQEPWTCKACGERVRMGGMHSCAVLSDAEGRAWIAFWICCAAVLVTFIAAEAFLEHEHCLACFTKGGVAACKQPEKPTP